MLLLFYLEIDQNVIVIKFELILLVSILKIELRVCLLFFLQNNVEFII